MADVDIGQRRIEIRKLYVRLVRRYIYGLVVYFGFRFKCPCCGGYFRRFLTQPGVNPRPDAVCPACYSLERHRLLWLYLKDRTIFFKKKLKVLEVAPMAFLQMRYSFCRRLDYLSIDMESPVAMIKADITEIKLPDNSFDCIICYHVLEHVSDDRKSMRELFRVLKPGGWAIIQSPIDNSLAETYEDASIVLPQDRECHFGQSDHVRLYGRDYKGRLEQAGFVVTVDDYVTQLPQKIVKRYGLMADESIYLCSKHETQAMNMPVGTEENIKGVFYDKGKRTKGQRRYSHV